MRQTTTAQLVEHKLGRSLPNYLKAQVLQQMGWRRIAEQIYRDTGVLVSHETVRSWHKKYVEHEAAA